MYYRTLRIANAILAPPLSALEQLQQLGFVGISHLSRICILGCSTGKKAQFFQDLKERGCKVYGSLEHFYVQGLFGKGVLVEFSHHPSAVVNAHMTLLDCTNVSGFKFTDSQGVVFVNAALEALYKDTKEPRLLYFTASQTEAVAIAQLFGVVGTKRCATFDTAHFSTAILRELSYLIDTPHLHLYSTQIADLNLNDLRYPDRFLPMPGMTHTKGVRGSSGALYKSYLGEQKSGVSHRLIAAAQPTTYAFVDTIVRSFGTYFKALVDVEQRRKLIPLLTLVHKDFFQMYENLPRKKRTPAYWFTQPKLAFGQTQYAELLRYTDSSAEYTLDITEASKTLRGVLAFCNAASLVHGFTPVYENLNTENYEFHVNHTANGYRIPTYAEWDILANGLDHEYPTATTDPHIPTNSCGFSVRSNTTAVELTIDGFDGARKACKQTTDFTAGFLDPNGVNKPNPRVAAFGATQQPIEYQFLKVPIHFRLVRYLFIGDR